MAISLKHGISKAFYLPATETKRHLWIDYARGIAIILVVYHHVFLGLIRSGISVPQPIVDANMAAYSFRMPLFFIFSGIFTGLSLHNKPVRKILWNKFSFLLYPYIIWSIIQITLQIFFNDYTNFEATYSNYLSILYQPKAIAHFWYLPALFNASVIFILLKSIFKIKPGYHLSLGILFFLLSPFINEISMISNWMRFYIFLVIGDTFSHFLLQQKTKNQLKEPLCFFAFIPIFVASQLYYFNVIGVRSLENSSASLLQVNYLDYSFNELSFLIVALVGCITFILLSFLIERGNHLKWLRIIGYHSLYIYIMHVIVVAFSRVVLVKFLGVENYVIILPLSVALGICIPVIFYNLVGKGYLWFLFSLNREKSKQQLKPEESNIKSSELKISPLQSTS